jgi:Tfp pilus assembly protein PilW
MTLLELMMVLAITSLVAGAVFSVFMSSLTTYWKGDINTQVQQGARLAFDRLTRDLRSARSLCSSSTCTPSGSFPFTVACTPNPQISFVLPHYGNMTLADGSVIYGTDADSSGKIPYNGSYVSYYLAATQGSTTQNASGPYLERTVYDITGVTLSTTSIASNITSLAFSAGGVCPTTASREVTVTVTASQNPASQNIPPSTAVLTMDVTLRNQ